MRIGLLIYGSLDTLSGGYLYDSKLVDHLRRRGEAVEILSLPWRNYLRHLGDNFSSGLLRRLASLPVDLLIQDELNHPSLFLLNRRLREHVQYPILSIAHHLRSSEARPAWQNRLYGLVERRYLASVDGFIFNSHTTRQAVEGRLPSGASHYSLVAIPGGDRLQVEITPQEIAARAWQPGPLRVLFVGNLIPRKGLRLLLAALESLPGQLWSLSIVGSPQMDPGHARSLQHQASRAGLAQRVRFCGKLEDGELVALMKSSHVLVVPSSYEGYGIVYLEGMGSGLPAIATTGGAAGEIITPGQDGYLVAPGDATALAGCIARLAQDRELLVRMSQAARRRYDRHPTWEASMQAIHQFLRLIANHKDSHEPYRNGTN